MSPDPPRTGRVETTPTELVDGHVFDNAAVGDYDPQLYAFDSIVKTIAGFESLTEQHIEQYREQGFLAIEDAFSLEQMSDAYQVLTEVILAGDSEAATIQYEAWAGRCPAEITSQELVASVRKLMDLRHDDPRLASIALDRRLLALVSRLMKGAAPALLQEMALLKQPNGREKPWHQDRAYFNVALETPVVGVWIALDPATPENGCMRLWPGRHREDPLAHFQRRDWQICDTEIQDQPCVAVPLESGGLLVFDALLPHGTPHNPTNQRRWAVQYHYYPKDAKKTGDEARMEIFGSGGKKVEC